MSYRIPPALDDADGAMPLEAPRWYIALTKGGQDRRAEASLTEILTPHGMAVYMPLERYWRSHARKTTKAVRPLFPGYIFVQATDALAMELPHLFRNSDGVRGILSKGGMVRGAPLPAPGAMVFRIMAMEAAGDFDETKELPLTIRKGVDVKITGGPMKGRTGVVHAVRSDHRIKVMLEALGVFGAGPMEIDLGLLAAA